MNRTSLIAVLLVAAACARDTGNTDTSAAATSGAAPDSAEMAAAISSAIAASPARADSILQANGHTTESFDALMFRIAADSGMSARYAAARTR